MDREYFFAGFVGATLVALIGARLLVARVEDSGLSRGPGDDPRATLYVQAAVLVLMWIALSLVTQIVSSTARAATEFVEFSFTFDPGGFDTSNRVRTQSITSGINTGVQLGFGIGLIGFAVNALRVAMRERLPFRG